MAAMERRPAVREADPREEEDAEDFVDDRATAAAGAARGGGGGGGGGAESASKKRKAVEASSGVRTKDGLQFEVRPQGDPQTWSVDAVPLSQKRMVQVRQFKGMTLVDIREFYEKDGELLPGKKGISLNPEQFRRLRDLIDEIGAEVDRLEGK